MRKFCSLKYWRNKLFLLCIYVLIQGIRLGLWAKSLQPVAQSLTKLAMYVQQTRLLKSLTIHQIVNAVQVSSYYSPGSVKCLVRALATKFLMDGAGYSGDLKIGVLKNATGDLEAHAWVEYQDHIVIGQVERLSEFVPLQ